ncbi:asc-type amino acid transporter 1-like [Poecilia latipinna]|uniref:asc-type amino acid transporter 1-like n=1 Tax=Poecilia latipinna TaxID=48699 RepID=UPI00072EC76E|nr:PREDICTED: asc-type amino acid transporter 1-like [Poecilia latipinna]
MCYAELGVTIPKSGGDYSYVTEIFGGLTGFLLLWSAVLIMYPTTLAVIALTFSSYVLQPVFQNCAPPYMATRLLSATCLLHLLNRDLDQAPSPSLISTRAMQLRSFI